MKKAKKLAENLANFAEMSREKGREDAQNVNPFQYLDPHKLCSLENDLEIVRNEVHEHKHAIKVLEEVNFLVFKEFFIEIFDLFKILLNFNENFIVFKSFLHFSKGFLKFIYKI